MVTTVLFAVTAGTDYVLQLGSYPGSASFGFGTFDIVIGGGGGGHRELAQAGGPDGASVPVALERAAEIVGKLLQ